MLLSGSTFYLSPDCQGGLFERLDKYNTAANDLWSLGVILVNLTCGRNPWRQACPSDETFRAFVHDPNFLRTILPISHQTNHILKGLFSLESKDRLSLKDLKRAVQAVDSFTMSEDELRTAHSAARAAAASYRPIPPATKPAPVAVPQSPQTPSTPRQPRQPVHAAHHRPSTPHHQHLPQVPPTPTTPAIDQKLDVVDVVDIEMEGSVYPVHPADRPSAWSHSRSHMSTSADFDIDAEVLDSIDFTHKPATPRQSPNRYLQPKCTSPPSPTEGRRRLPMIPQRSQLAPRPKLETFESEPYSMVPNSSRSSSSEAPTLPPTPEFNPADKTSLQSNPVPEWNLVAQVDPMSKANGMHVTVDPMSTSTGVRVM